MAGAVPFITDIYSLESAHSLWTKVELRVFYRREELEKFDNFAKLFVLCQIARLTRIGTLETWLVSPVARFDQRWRFKRRWVVFVTKLTGIGDGNQIDWSLFSVHIFYGWRCQIIGNTAVALVTRLNGVCNQADRW